MKSILVVKDSALIMELIRFLLTSSGYEIKMTRDGFEALKIAGKNRLDFILPDLQLPGLDGLKIIKDIKSLPEAGRRPATAALTAHSMKDEKSRFLKAGCREYVSKLINVDGLKTISDM